MRGGEMIILLLWERGDEVCVTCIVGGVILRDGAAGDSSSGVEQHGVGSPIYKGRSELEAVAKW
jgi:hypothetical protein